MRVAAGLGSARAMMYLLTLYLILSLIAALLGRRRWSGFVGTFLLSLLFSPLVTILFLVAFRQRPEA